MNHSQPTFNRTRERNPFHDLSSSISRSVIHRDYFIVVIIQFEQAGQGEFDILLFIARRHDDRNPRIFPRIAVPFRLRDVGNARHADRSIDDAREPRQRENRACNPVKVMHPA